jgi:predicted glycoside hydrolase/deacetylase ChbG (UPF0249 family)
MTPSHLIVNADDFGCNDGVNKAIAACHRAGTVTSASLMATGKAAEQAAALAADLPDLSVGLHWVGDRPGVAMVDLADADALRAELDRQLALFADLIGRPPTHLDSHHHLHLGSGGPGAGGPGSDSPGSDSPGWPVMDVFLAAAKPLGIPVRGLGPARFVGDFHGQTDGGQSDLDRVSLAALERILRREAAQGGTVEVCCHPGHETASMRSAYTVEREAELRTLTDPCLPGLIAELGFELIGRGKAHP